MRVSSAIPSTTVKVAQPGIDCAASKDGRNDIPRRPSLMQALSRLARPAFRLHRYRNVRTKFLQDAFSDLDCSHQDDLS